MQTAYVSLFTREWIEIATYTFSGSFPLSVSLFTREWIEIAVRLRCQVFPPVSLFTREWIEIIKYELQRVSTIRLPLYEGAD